MPVRLDKPWQPLTQEAVATIPGQLGVLQLADDAGTIVLIDFAGARALFGLRSALQAHLANPPANATQFRVEINTQYTTRYRELLMAHVADHGDLPTANQQNPPVGLGRLSPG